MKKIQDFAAQQLSKRQMNEVKGGWRCFVITKWGDGDRENEGYYIEVEGNSAREAADNIKVRPEGAVGVAC